MYPPSPKPMETATVARRAGLLVQSRPGSSWPRARTWGHGAGVGYSFTARSAARRRLLVASLGVREPLPAQSHSLDAITLLHRSGAARAEEHADDSPQIPPSPDVLPDAKTARVKFVLEKECAFGQQFLLVGDDPALGVWDPAKAVALDWSDGHVWTVKTDLPANKLIEFKFLLRDVSGHVRWQDGANRTLRTTESPNTLVVHEDWDHGENQRLSEEEELMIATVSDGLAGGSGTTPADDELIRDEEDLESNKSALAYAPASLHWETMTANEENQPQFILENDRKILNEFHGPADTRSQNGYPSDDDNASPNEDDITMYQEDIQFFDENEDAQVANRSASIFENDLAWARKAMRELLRFLGFQIGTTRT